MSPHASAEGPVAPTDLVDTAGSLSARRPSPTDRPGGGHSERDRGHATSAPTGDDAARGVARAAAGTTTLDVLYVGPLAGTSRHRHDAFKRLGHRVRLFEPRRAVPASAWVDRIEWHLAPEVPAWAVRRRLSHELDGHHYDLAFVDNGSMISAAAVRLLKQHCRAVVNFNHDDPYGQRDGVRFRAFRAAVPEYDLVTVVRRLNVAEADTLGARDVLRHPMVADDVAHRPRAIGEAQRRHWASEVAFIGSWMPERGPFLSRLIERGVPLALYGSGWQKAREWPRLAPHHRAEHLEGDDYAYAIQCARVSLGLLSQGNRDQHTTRSTEIPMLGGLLCAERSDEHLEMYDDGVEAAFWRDADECADLCLALLADENRRHAMAEAGQRRSHRNRLTSEHLIEAVIARLGLASGSLR